MPRPSQATLQGVEAVEAVLSMTPETPSPMIGVSGNAITRLPLEECVEQVRCHVPCTAWAATRTRADWEALGSRARCASARRYRWVVRSKTKTLLKRWSFAGGSLWKRCTRSRPSRARPSTATSATTKIKKRCEIDALAAFPGMPNGGRRASRRPDPQAGAARYTTDAFLPSVPCKLHHGWRHHTSRSAWVSCTWGLRRLA